MVNGGSGRFLPPIGGCAEHRADSLVLIRIEPPDVAAPQEAV